jgi:hypothetical protein
MLSVIGHSIVSGCSKVVKFAENRGPFIMFILNILCAIAYNYEYYIIYSCDYDAFINQGIYARYEYYFADTFGSSLLVCALLMIMYWKRKYCITTIITLAGIMVLHVYNLVSIKMMFYAPVYDLFIITLFIIILLVYKLQIKGALRLYR